MNGLDGISVGDSLVIRKSAIPSLSVDTPKLIRSVVHVYADVKFVVRGKISALSDLKESGVTVNFPDRLTPFLIVEPVVAKGGGTFSRYEKVTWSLENIEKNWGSIDIVKANVEETEMTVNLPKPSTNVYKVLRFISEHPDGVTYSDMQRFVCQLNGIDFDHRTRNRWNNKMERTNRGYYSTNIYQWNKKYKYIQKNKNSKYVLTSAIAQAFKTIDSMAKPMPQTQVNKIEDVKIPQATVATVAKSEIGDEVNSILAKIEKLNESYLECEKIMSSAKAQMTSIGLQKAELKNELNKVLVQLQLDFLRWKM